MKYRYVTIEREYGSRGTKIAEKLAKSCQIPCYGREILELVAKEQNIDVEDIERYEESVTNSVLYTIFMLGRVQAGDTDVLTNEGHIFVAEQNAITRMAATGPAIFVGHCACEALKDTSGVLRAFIKADKKDRIKHIVEDYGISKDKAEEVMHRFDKKRANYYYANTAKKWRDENNYDLVLDSGKLGVDGCEAAIKGVFNNIF